MSRERRVPRLNQFVTLLCASPRSDDRRMSDAVHATTHLPAFERCFTGNNPLPVAFHCAPRRVTARRCSSTTYSSSASLLLPLRASFSATRSSSAYAASMLACSETIVACTEPLVERPPEILGVGLGWSRRVRPGATCRPIALARRRSVRAYARPDRRSDTTVEWRRRIP